MVLPFFKIKSKVQEEHTLFRDDVIYLSELEKNRDPRVMHYCKALKAHKKVCPICSWPRAYSFIRKTERTTRSILLRKIW